MLATLKKEQVSHLSFESSILKEITNMWLFSLLVERKALKLKPKIKILSSSTYGQIFYLDKKKKN